MRLETAPRAARVTLVAVALTVLTLAGHTAGSGALDLFGATVVALISTALALATTGRRSARLRWTPLVGLLLAGQGLLHVIMTFTSAHAHQATSSGIDASWMVTGHVVAALVSATLIVLADQLILRWQSYLQAIIGGCRWILVEPSTRAGFQPALAASTSTVTDSPLRHDVIRRGPPVLVSALS